MASTLTQDVRKAPTIMGARGVPAARRRREIGIDAPDASASSTPPNDPAAWVDGALKATDTTSPYSYGWDTTTVANGSHTLLTTYSAGTTPVSAHWSWVPTYLNDVMIDWLFAQDLEDRAGRSSPLRLLAVQSLKLPAHFREPRPSARTLFSYFGQVIAFWRFQNHRDFRKAHVVHNRAEALERESLAILRALLPPEDERVVRLQGQLAIDLYFHPLEAAERPQDRS